MGLRRECVHGTKVAVWVHEVNLRLCVSSLSDQVCGYLIPTPGSESRGAGLFLSENVCAFMPVVISVCVSRVDKLLLDP